MKSVIFSYLLFVLQLVLPKKVVWCGSHTESQNISFDNYWCLELIGGPLADCETLGQACLKFKYFSENRERK